MNAVGTAGPTVAEVKDKWKNLHSTANKEFATFKRETKKTGGGPAPYLVPRSHSVTGNVRSAKVRFRACSVPARPQIRAFLSVRMFVLSVVILGDFAE